jgi:hypothetical protein
VERRLSMFLEPSTKKALQNEDAPSGTWGGTGTGELQSGLLLRTRFSESHKRKKATTPVKLADFALCKKCSFMRLLEAGYCSVSKDTTVMTIKTKSARATFLFPRNSFVNSHPPIVKARTVRCVSSMYIFILPRSPEATQFIRSKRN